MTRMRTSGSGQWMHALAGIVAAVVALAAGHLVAAIVSPASSPVLSVSSAVIDFTPTPVKTWAISTFGTADKPLLIGSVALVTLAFAALIGITAARRFAIGATMLLVLAAVAAAAVTWRPAATGRDVVAALVTAVVGLGALRLLIRRPPGHLPRTKGPGMSRRSFLTRSTILIAGSALLAGTGQWIRRAALELASVVLPEPADPAPRFPIGLDEQVSGISPLRTPTADFYRVDINLTVPVVELDGWTLTIDGDVEREIEFTFDELLSIPLIERDITMTCVSNEVGGSYIGSARWLGVPIKALLDQAGVGSQADQILSTAIDGFTISTPLEVALDGRDMMVAVAMNGEPLPRAHGFPARLMTPGIYGYVGATKWLSRLTLTRFDSDIAYWTERGWAEEGPIKISSRIDTPRGLGQIEAGEHAIAGVAWAQQRGVGRVEVQIDGEGWTQARLGPDVGIDYWRQWYLPWQATTGRHELRVRAVTIDGEVQTERRAAPFPDGSSGYQQIIVQVG